MKKLLIWGIPLLAVIGMIGWRFREMKSAESSVAGAGAKKAGATVEVALAKPRTMIQALQTVANIESPIKAEISPKTAGRIELLEVREGDKVVPGQTLLQIDPSDLQGAVLQAEASVAEAKYRYTQAKIVQNSTNVGVTSQVQQQVAGLSSAKASFEQVKQNFASQISSAKAQVSQAEDAVSNAKASLDKESATLLNLQTKYDRTLYLYKQNFIAAQDVDDARTAIEVQKGAVAVAKGQLSSAESQLNVQQQSLLIAERKGKADIAVSQATLEQGQATLRIAQANRSQTPAYQQNLDALQSQVVAAEAQLRQAQAKLSDTIIRSTLTGTVTARKADPGGLATPGTPVLEIQFLDWLYITATLPIDYSSLIKQGQSAEITIDGIPNKTFLGPITNINPAADSLSRQFGIKVRLENRDHLVRPGMFGRLKLITKTVAAKVVVPNEAVLTKSDGSTSVAIVTDDNVAHVHKVKLGVTDDKGAEILEGVEPGDRVVVLTFNPIKDGQKVVVADSSKDSKKGKAEDDEAPGKASDAKTKAKTGS